MALEGNAKDFGLSEIFQLIAIQKKSGVLTITGEETMAVFFRDGQLISTRDRRNRTRDPLKDYLLRYGFIGRDEMNRVQQIQVETNMDLTEILISEKFFSEDELETIFTEQIQESVTEVLSWPKSYYKFTTAKHILHGVTSYASLKVEGILMEAMRRIDEFPEFLRIFPSEDMIVKRLEISSESPPELYPYEEFVYELLEKELPISSVLRRARMARFCTYEVLKNLLEKELLLIVAGPPKSEQTAKQEKAVKRRRSKGKRIAPTLTALTLLLCSYGIGEYLVPELLPPGWSDRAWSPRKKANAEHFMLSSFRELRNRQLEESIREGLEEYRAVKGSYPFTLEILAVRNFVPKNIVDLSYQHSFRYRTINDGESYSLAKK